MEREASFLRCSKLNCYSEFNRMVQALSIHGRRESHHCNLRPPNKGTGTEYNFYQTLSIMLQQVLSNPDSNGQRSELKMIYQWFSLNKPLASQRVKPSAQRPKLVLSRKRNVLLSSRPQTAPAALGGSHSFCKTPVCPPSTPALTSFASNYMASRTVRSHDLPVRPSSQPLPVRNDWLIDGEKDQSLLKSPNSLTTGERKSCLLDQNILRGMTSETIVVNASSVAAQMTLDRFMSDFDKSSVITKHRTLNNEKQTIHKTQTVAVPLTKQENSPQRQQSPSVERSKSLTTLETISEVDNEYYVIDPMIKDASDDMKHVNYSNTNMHETITCTEKKEIEQPLEITNDKESETITQIPKVTIENISTKTKPTRHNTAIQKPLSAGGEPFRRVCQVQVISLNLQSATTSDNMTASNTYHSQTRKPKKLVPIVAGFNQQKYRPRTVA